MDDLIAAMRVVAQHLVDDRAGTGGIVLAGAERLEQLEHENARLKDELQYLKHVQARHIDQLECELSQYRVAAYEITRQALMSKS